MGTPAKKRDVSAATKKGVGKRPRRAPRRDNGVDSPTKSEIIVKLPVKNDHIAAAIPGSNARELIKRVAEVAGSLNEIQRQQKQQQQRQQRPPKQPQAPSASRAPSREPKRSSSTTMMLWLRNKIYYLGFVVLCGSFVSATPIQNMSSENSFDRIQAGQWVVASMYWQDKLTSTGKAFKPVGLYAAHKTLPIGTLIRVSNPKNHRSINITVNDRGPYIAGRDLDLTLGAGALLGFEGLGTLYMEVLAIPPFENIKRPLVENLFAVNDANANVNCPTGEKCALKRTAAR